MSVPARAVDRSSGSSRPTSGPGPGPLPAMTSVPTRSRNVGIVSALLCSALAACSSATGGGGASALGSSSVAVPSPPTIPWNFARPAAHAGTGPAFPATVAGFRLADDWNPLPIGLPAVTWVYLEGDRETFPSADDDCADTVFLLRWRTTRPITFLAAQAGPGTLLADPAYPPRQRSWKVVAASGWGSTDGCTAPMVGLGDAEPGASSGPDAAPVVHVEAQEWYR